MQHYPTKKIDAFFLKQEKDLMKKMGKSGKSPDKKRGKSKRHLELVEEVVETEVKKESMEVTMVTQESE